MVIRALGDKENVPTLEVEEVAASEAERAKEEEREEAEAGAVRAAPALALKDD